MFSRLTKNKINNIKNKGLNVAIKALEEAKKLDVNEHINKANFFNREILKDKHTRLCLETLSESIGIGRLKVNVLYDEEKGQIVNWNLMTKDGVTLKEFTQKDELVRYIKTVTISEDKNEMKNIKRIYISKSMKEELSEEV